jgi:hypothetical protein
MEEGRGLENEGYQHFDEVRTERDLEMVKVNAATKSGSNAA